MSELGGERGSFDQPANFEAPIEDPIARALGINMGQLILADHMGETDTLVTGVDIGRLFRGDEPDAVARRQWLDSIHTRIDYNSFNIDAISSLTDEEVNDPNTRFLRMTLGEFLQAEEEDQLDGMLEALRPPRREFEVGPSTRGAMDVIHTGTEYLTAAGGFVAAGTAFTVGLKAFVKSFKDLIDEVRPEPEPEQPAPPPDHREPDGYR